MDVGMLLFGEVEQACVTAGIVGVKISTVRSSRLGCEEAGTVTPFKAYVHTRKPTCVLQSSAPQVELFAQLASARGSRLRFARDDTLDGGIMLCFAMRVRIVSDSGHFSAMVVLA